MILPKPGTIGLAKIGGVLGRAIRAGQVLTGDISPWTHAFVVVDNRRVIEAQPGGARYASLRHYLRPGQAVFLAGWPDLSREQRALVPELAERLIGTPYSFLDYFSIAALSVGIKLPLTRRRVRDSGHMICSQLADYMMCVLGAPLFDDGRESMDVTPGDLHLRWTEAVSQLSLERGFPPIPATDVVTSTEEQDFDESSHQL